MKRKYIQPQTMAIRVDIENIMATSDRIPIDNTPGIPAAREDESIEIKGVWESVW
ncbi:MAG: hypothetical protein IKB39_08500 [Bacteroidaceae bacterium]|nr:hypothetical protein [Bacteroidaceae bacterium]